MREDHAVRRARVGGWVVVEKKRRVAFRLCSHAANRSCRRGLQLQLYALRLEEPATHMTKEARVGAREKEWAGQSPETRTRTAGCVHATCQVTPTFLPATAPSRRVGGPAFVSDPLAAHFAEPQRTHTGEPPDT